SEMNVIHAPPAITMTTMSAGRFGAAAISAIITPRMAMAVETTVSIDHRALAFSITTAPPTAPAPNDPSKIPYVIALALSVRAMVGNRAKTALAQNITTPARSMTALTTGALRT